MHGTKAVSPPSRCRFFDQEAAEWDSRIKTADYRAIEKIFERIPFDPSDTVFDVGAGTGIMIPFYQRRGLNRIFAIDSSERMVTILRTKFPDVTVFHRSYLSPMEYRNFADKIVIFNTFPHFSDFEPVFAYSSRYLKPGGKLIIAHSMSREALKDCHRRKGRAVEGDILPPDDFFVDRMRAYGFWDVTVENPESGFFAAGTSRLEAGTSRFA